MLEETHRRLTATLIGSALATAKLFYRILNRFSDTTLPLDVGDFATWMGFAASVLAMIGIAYALAVRLLTKAWVPGWATVFVGALFLGGIQPLSLGIIASADGRTLYYSARQSQANIWLVRRTTQPAP